MPDRRVAPAVAVFAIAVLACVSLPELHLEYAPDVQFPELRVRLQLPADASVDSTETTRQWVIPIESALRAAGDTTGTRGEIDAGSALIVARFKRGTDVAIKAARIASDLAPLRARLPRRASLSITSSGSVARPAAILAVLGTRSGAAAERIADALRSTPGVRDVQSFGTTPAEVDVRLLNATPVTAASILRELLPLPLGTVEESSRRLPLVAMPAAQRIGDVLLPAPVPLRLRDVATITLHEQEPQSVARFDGRPAVILNVFRDESASLFAFDRAVWQTAGRDAVVIASDAAEVRTILLYGAIGAAAATLIVALGAGWTAGAYIPLAIALLVNFWRAAQFRVDAQTLLASAIAIAGMMPFAVTRTESRLRRPVLIAVLFAWLVPLAAVFSGGALSPLLSPPALDFAIAATCAALAASFVATRPRPALAPRRMKQILRNPASVVLACFAVAIFFLSWFGPWLNPRRSQGSADHSLVFIRAEAPSGTTVAQTVAAVAPIESAIRHLNGVKHFWTSIAAGEADIAIETDRRIRQPARFEAFQNTLRSRLPLTFGSITIAGSSDRSTGATLPETIEEQPYTDENGRTYRFLLKGTDADVLRRTAEALSTRLARAGVSRGEIHLLWPEPSPRIDLVRRATTSGNVANAVAAELHALTLPPEDVELPGGSLLRVAEPDAPKGANDVPRRADLFARPLTVLGHTITVESAFEPRPAFTQGTVTRELGRFVLPVEVDVNGMTRELTIAKRNDIDRTLSLAPLPAGVFVDRPQIEQWRASIAELRLLAVAAFLPLLLFALPAIVTGSFRGTLAALAPAAVALALVAPVLAAAFARLDEMTLLATGAALCGVAAFSADVVLRTGGGSPAQTLRTVRPFGRPVAAATLASAAFLFVAAAASSAMGDGWRAPLLAAGTVLAAGIPTGLLLPSAVALLLRGMKRHRVMHAAIASPIEWSDVSARPELSVRNLTKVYPGGFTALRRVSFELTPGIVGLLGPNGAGKTTLLRILTGLLQPTRGHVAYRGVRLRPENLANFQRSIGFLPQEFNAYAGLSAEEFLDYWALERGVELSSERAGMIERALRVAGLEEHATRRVRDFSGGMRQRIGIARALLGDPPLLVVDEPTTGLDIEARRRFRDLLTTLAADRIVILSSHIASDVESTASRLLLLVGGRLQWDGPLEGLLARAAGRVFEQIVGDGELLEFVRRYRITARVRVPEGIRVRGVISPEQRLPGVAVKPTLEDAYLAEVSRTQPARHAGSFSFLFQKG